ncbi:serine peptidase [Purpureocillium lavendulum]|uniref:Serine peptidase n=1 Tax=Purpureocillium lavendulum TaxID=1247861 RepID=A0AB34FK29_9HYPO|nr:serine peptidase [Purpureocillium lavendulum]
MPWRLRKKETETYRYSRSGRDPLYEHPYRGARRPFPYRGDEYPSYTNTYEYGTYIYPACDKAHYCNCACCPRRGRRASDLARLECDRDRCPCNCYRRSTWDYRQMGPGSSPSRVANLRECDGGASRGRTVIDVVNRSNGSTSPRHADRFVVSIEPHAAVDDIVALLAPDQRRHKVVVRWRDGDAEDLDSMIPVDEICRYARRLDVKDRKHVRWA